MAISSSTRKAGPFLGNDATTVFPFAFKVFTSADLRVVRTNALGVESDLVLDTDYTVALNANQDNDPGGTVTRGTALPTGERLTITSDVEALQPLVLTNNGGFYPRVINDAFDKITIIAQQLIEQVGRSLKLPISSTASATLPDPVANRLIAWNSSANGFTNVNPASLATVAAYADANLELFTGNGTQTAFTLAQDPAVLANLDVSISGVTQVGGEDFTWIGTTLTFVVAPPNGTRIQVRYTRAIPPADLAAAVAAAEADRVATAADRVQTGLDRVQTGLDRIATAADVVSAEADRVATAADAVATAADRVQTGLDRIATAADVAATANKVSLTALAASTGSSLVGWEAGVTGDADRTVQAKLREIRTFEDFGAVGDANASTGAGTDDTLAIQAALDWAFANVGAIYMTAKNFLCGNIITYPYTTIIGTGRHTSNFIIKTGTTGKWFTDNGNAAKTTLSGIAWYARSLTAVTHILDLGNNGIQFGTEGTLSGLFIRDAVNGYGLNVNGNVGFFREITTQSCRNNVKITGNANKLSGIVSMQAGQGTTGSIGSGPANVIGLDLSGCNLSQIEIEATASGGLPVKMNGDCKVSSYTISTSAGTFSHLVEVDTGTYDEWSLIEPTMFVSGGPTITNGIVKVGSVYQGGTSPTAFSGKSIMSALNIQSGAFRLKDALYQAFQVRIINTAGTLQHRIGAVSDSGTAGPYSTKIVGASTTLTNTPTGAGAFAAGVSLQASGNTLVFNTTAAQVVATVPVAGYVVFNTGGTVLTAFANVSTYTVNGVAAERLAISFYDASSGAAYNLTTLAAGELVQFVVIGHIL